jgi:hypothetical protein
MLIYACIETSSWFNIWHHRSPNIHCIRPFVNYKHVILFEKFANLESPPSVFTHLKKLPPPSPVYKQHNSLMEQHHCWRSFQPFRDSFSRFVEGLEATRSSSHNAILLAGPGAKILSMFQRERKNCPHSQMARTLDMIIIDVYRRWFESHQGRNLF